jgi:hypothetical protein
MNTHSPHQRRLHICVDATLKTAIRQLAAENKETVGQIITRGFVAYLEQRRNPSAKPNASRRKGPAKPSTIRKKQ